MSRLVWESCNKPADYLDGLEVFGGLDLSARTDLTGFVLIGRDAQGIWHVNHTLGPPQRGCQSEHTETGSLMIFGVTKGICDNAGCRRRL